MRDVSTWPVVEAEPLGRDRKVWLRDPTVPAMLATKEHNWLFKPVVIPRHGVSQGEDWVEKLVSELGRLLRVPCAEVDLAERHGEAGSVSRNVVPDRWELVLGSELMSGRRRTTTPAVWASTCWTAVGPLFSANKASGAGRSAVERTASNTTQSSRAVGFPALSTSHVVRSNSWDTMTGTGSSGCAASSGPRWTTWCALLRNCRQRHVDSSLRYST
jgi:hypothetical protein